MNKYKNLSINQENYQQSIGGGNHWEKRGLFQLEKLMEFGLKPHHKLLDVGCGPLRSGVYFISYLNCGNYYGIDFNRDMIDIAKTRLTPELQDKNPTITHINNFDFGTLNKKFDFILAWSVLNHCEEYDRIIFFNNISKYINSTGVIYISHGEWFKDEKYKTNLMVEKIKSLDVPFEWMENHVFPIIKLKNFPTFPKTIRVFALKRSGQHAIIHWIISQLSGKTLHLNNPRCEQSMMFNLQYENGYYFENGKLLQRGNFQDLQNLPIDNFLCNFEDRVLEPYANKYKNLQRKKETGVGVSLQEHYDGNFFNIIIIRDPYNLFASRLQHSKIHTISNRIDALGANSIEAISTWKDYANAYLGDKYYFKNLITINYNRWFSDIEYRKLIAQKLNVTFSDIVINDIPPIGISSFDEYKFNGKAQEMPVLKRYKAYKHNMSFWNLFDSELIDVTKKIFNIEIPMRIF